jgi:pimeloyl-ACP methyl ester carboxylesterase
MVARQFGMAQPTVILIHGTWHGAWCWAEVQERLDQRGIVSIAPSLKGVGERFDEADETVGVDDHIADVIAAIRAADAPCVVLGHSYGSIPMWGAASAVPDRIVALIDLDGFLPRADVCAFDMLPPIRPIFDGLIMPDRPWLIRPMDAATLGVTDPAEVEAANRRLTPTPLRTHTDLLRLQGEAWSGPRFYIRAANEGRLFEKTAQLAASEGWTVSSIPGGHDLQAANPDGVTDAIAGVVEQFT